MARKSKLFTRAQAMTSLRYGSEARGLKALLREARTDLKIGLKAEEGSAEGIIAAAREAGPELRAAYQDAGHTQATADADVKKALAGLTAAGSPIAGVSASESAAARARLAASFARASGELQSRKVEAATGAVYQKRNLVAQYGQTAQKIRGQRQDLNREKGLYLATTLGDLGDKAADRRIKRQSAAETRRHNRAGESHAEETSAETRRHNQQVEANQRRDDARARAKDKAGGAKGGPTTTQTNSARDSWDKGKHIVQQLASNKKSKHASDEKWINFLIGEGIKAPIAEGLVQHHRYGGVTPGLRRKLEGRYGIRPKVRKKHKSPSVLSPFIGPSY